MTSDPTRRVHPPQPAKHTSTKRAPQRELEETLLLDKRNANAKEMASEVFVHGLLMSRAENNQDNAEQQRETRISAILQRIENVREGRESAPRFEQLADLGNTSRSPSLLRRFAAVAAGIALILGGYGIWDATRSEAGRDIHAEEILEKVRLSYQEGIHVYTGSVYLRVFKKQDGQLQFSVALGEGKKFHLRFRWPGSKLKGYLELGNDGQTYWAKSAKGKAFELLYDNRGKRTLEDLSPELSYLEIRPIIEKILTEKGLAVEKDFIGKDGKKLVRLAGPFRTKRTAHRGWGGRRRAKHRDSRQAQATFITGKIQILVEKESGLLRKLTQIDSSGRNLFEIRRQDDQGADERSWINFNPSRARVGGATRLFLWGLDVMFNSGRRQKALKTGSANLDSEPTREKSSLEKK